MEKLPPSTPAAITAGSPSPGSEMVVYNPKTDIAASPGHLLPPGSKTAITAGTSGPAAPANKASLGPGTLIGPDDPMARVGWHVQQADARIAHRQENQRVGRDLLDITRDTRHSGVASLADHFTQAGRGRVPTSLPHLLAADRVITAHKTEYKEDGSDRMTISGPLTWLIRRQLETQHGSPSMYRGTSDNVRNFANREAAEAWRAQPRIKRAAIRIGETVMTGGLGLVFLAGNRRK